jgi:hypothetical protein
MSISCAIHQPNFLPWLGYFYKMSQADVFVYLDNVDIVLGSSKAITHRARIKTQHGATWLTIPLKKSNSKKINEIEIDGVIWKRKMLKTIEQTYARAAFREDGMRLLDEIFRFESLNLSEFNIHGIEVLKSASGIATRTVRASELNLCTEDRNQRIVDLCRLVGAHTYISGQGAAKYHNPDVFAGASVTLQYTGFVHPEYNQLHESFIPGLSVLDYLFNMGITKTGGKLFKMGKDQFNSKG